MDNTPRAAGQLIVICGPMFAGKTSELLRRAASAKGDDVAVAVIKPRGDVRYCAEAIVTHTGLSLACRAVDDAAEIAAAAGDAALVLIDEAHFFGAPLAGAALGLVSGGADVIVAGLELDHRGAPFEPFPRLLCEANEVRKLTCPCARCGAPAQFSQRLVESSERIVVGGAEAYEPRCRACFVPGK